MRLWGLRGSPVPLSTRHWERVGERHPEPSEPPVIGAVALQSPRCLKDTLQLPDYP